MHAIYIQQKLKYQCNADASTLNQFIRQIKLFAGGWKMPPFARSAAVRVFDSVFGKYVVYCFRSSGLDITAKHKFINTVTYVYIIFLFLVLFSVIYTTLTAEMETKLIALAGMGPSIQVRMRPNL